MTLVAFRSAAELLELALQHSRDPLASQDLTGRIGRLYQHMCDYQKAKKKFFGSFQRHQKKGKTTGLLNFLLNKLNHIFYQNQIDELKDIIQRIETEIIPQCESAVVLNNELMNEIIDVLQNRDDYAKWKQKITQKNPVKKC